MVICYDTPRKLPRPQNSPDLDPALACCSPPLLHQELVRSFGPTQRLLQSLGDTPCTLEGHLGSRWAFDLFTYLAQPAMIGMNQPVLSSPKEFCEYQTN